jgi:hypothetical protein
MYLVPIPLDIEPQFVNLVTVEFGGVMMKKLILVAFGVLFTGAFAIFIQNHFSNTGNTNSTLSIAGRTVNIAVLDRLQSIKTNSNFSEEIKSLGSTIQRPSYIPKGFIYFDTTLKKSIYWDGQKWIENSVFNIKDLGAKGDGVTDDTKAIQNALNLAQINSKITIYFPEGIYNTQALRLYSNTYVTLNQKAVIKRVGKGFNLFTNGKSGDKNYAFGYNGEGNIHFNGGTIDLNAVYNPIPSRNDTSAFVLGHGEKFSFKNLTIINGQNGHYFEISSSKNVLIDNCWFGNVVYTNKSSRNFELIQIEEANKFSFPHFGSYDGTISKNIIIQNSHFENVIRGIGTHGFVKAKNSDKPLRYNENIKIINNVFKNSIGEFGYFEGFKNVIIENNVFKNYGQKPLYFNQTVNYSVKNNRFINSSSQNDKKKNGQKS